MADLTEAYAALQKADAAGDTAGAKQLADYIRSQSAAPSSAPAAAAPESMASQAKRGLLAAPDILATGALNIPYSILSSAYNLGRRVVGDNPDAPEPKWMSALQAHLAPGTQQTLAEAASLPGIKQTLQDVQTAGNAV